VAHIMEYILGRRSIRRFEDRPVEPDQIDQLLKAAMAAPSASNRKPWEFVVVTDAEVLARLRRTLVFGRYEAPVAIAVCGNMRRTYPPPARDFYVEDCSAAIQNILLAAHGLGLGAVWIGVHPVPPFMRGVSRALELPRHVRPVGLVHVGFPAESKPPRTQYDASRVHWQKWRGVDSRGEHGG
jgi:nitroreductase